MDSTNDPGDIEGITHVWLGQVASSAGLPALRIKNAFCSATVALQGAQLLTFQATGKAPLLWLSDRVVFRPGKAIRGGVPLCFPWFGPHPGDSSKPAHGFARNSEGPLRQATAHEAGHTLVFALHADAETRALWPFEFAAELTMELGKDLRLALSVRNTGEQAFSFTSAFHSYFPVQDITQAEIAGLDGSRCIDQLAGTRTPYQHHGNIVFTGETDRIYLDASGEYSITDGTGQTRIKADNCHSAIVWNPWQEKTATLGDMSGAGWRGMVCVECGNVESNALSVLPGQQVCCALQMDSDH